MCRKFTKEKDMVDSREAYLATKRRLQMAKQLDGYLGWIIQTGEIII